MRAADILISLSAHAVFVAILFLWPVTQPAPHPKTFTVGMVQLVRPRTVEAPSCAPEAAQPAASAPKIPAPVVSPQPVPTQPKAPAVQARPAHAVAKKISPKKRSAAAAEKPSSPTPIMPTTPEQTQQAVTAAPDTGSGMSAGSSPPHVIGGMGVYDVDAVEVPPKIVSRESPQYPPSARRLHMEGTVIVSMVIDVQGKPRHCAIRKAVPEGVFEEYALAAANSYRFVPGKVGGQNVPTLVIVPFHFKMVN